MIGRRLELADRELTYTVVGVAPPGLEFPAGADLWVPLIPLYTPAGAETPSISHVEPIGRLANGVTPSQAAAEMMTYVSNHDANIYQNPRLSPHTSTLPDLVTGDVRSAVLVLSGAAALLLLIACINAANLLLVRASNRREEIAVRRALGAGRGRVLRQLLTESSVLALAGGLLGSVLAIALVRGLLALAPAELPRLDEIRLSGVPFGFAATVTILAVIAFGLVPSIWTSGDVGSPLRAAGRSSTGTSTTRRVQDALVVLQLGLGIVVLAAACLLGRTLVHLQRLDMGLAADQVVMVQLNWPVAKYESRTAVSALLYDGVVPNLEALPEIVSADPVNAMPFAGASAGGWDGMFVAEGEAAAGPDAGQVFNMEVVGPDFFKTLGVPLVRGRGFTVADREGAPRVVVVNEAATRLLWPGEDPIGSRIGLGRPGAVKDWRTVVGVAADARYRALREPTPTVYLPHRQFTGGPGLSKLVVRTTGDPAAAVPVIRRAVLDTDPDLLVLTAAPMERLVAQQLARPRMSAFLLAAFGAGALLLAAVGLYAVLAFAVRQRAPELAIRHALGASPSRLRALVLRQALVLAVLGVVLGLAAALAGGRLLESLLFGVSPSDPLTLAGVVAVLLSVALAASYIPARRAMGADPVAVLREE